MEQKNDLSTIRPRSSAFYCVEQDSFLHADNIDARLYPASVTKLVTACTALKFLSTDTVVTVGDEYYLIDEHSSLALVFPGYKLLLSDLLAGSLLSSGCDAAYTIAAAAAREAFPDKEMNAGQAVECFAGLMNEFASSIGMNDSHFINPDGQDADGHYSTAADLIKLGRYALTIPAITETTVLSGKISDIVSGEHIVWLTTNKLRVPDSEYYCPDAVGLKTGTTSCAGSILLAAFKRSGKTYISFTSGFDTRHEVFMHTLDMLSEYT